LSEEKVEREFHLALQGVQCQVRDDSTRLNTLDGKTVHATSGIGQVHLVEHIYKVGSELKRISLAECNVLGRS
jgi:hypothetical protein